MIQELRIDFVEAKEKTGEIIWAASFNFLDV